MSVPPPQTAPPTPRGHVQEGFAWWSPFAALFCAYAAAIVFAAILAGATGNADGGDLPPGVILGATFIQDVLLVVAMVMFARLSGASTSPAAFGLRKVPPGRALALAAVAFVVFYAFLLAWSQLDTGAKDDLAKDLGAKDSTLALIAVAVLVGIVAPIVEELFFRGFLFGALGRVMHWFPAALATGVVFGGVHAGGTPAIFLVPLALLGVLLCALYRRTGSLLPGMGVHAFNNALALGVSLHWSFDEVLLGVFVAPLAVLTIAGQVADR
ncbi:MAG: protease family protein [Solirubrobacteraceae bacterium]|nr:protease family protein [Solirubrobacteraceae bacterium]